MGPIISIIGILVALVFLSYMVMKGVNIFVVAICAALIVAITGQINLYDAMETNYMAGFAGFVQNNFLIFLVGSMMGIVYDITNGAKSIARLIIRTAGPKNAALAVVLSTGILTYGGIAGFVVCFAVFPIALEIYRAADIPRRFIPGTIIFGCCTFSSIGPGNPQVGQVVLVNALGTTLMSGAVVGFIATGVTLVVGIVWLFSRFYRKGPGRKAFFLSLLVVSFLGLWIFALWVKGYGQPYYLWMDVVPLAVLSWDVLLLWLVPQMALRPRGRVQGAPL